KGKPETGAATLPRFELEPAAVLLDHGAAQAQADAEATVLRREEGLEQHAPGLDRNTPATVENLDRDARRIGIVVPRGDDLEEPLALRRIRHRLYGVAGQVEQDLLEHGAVPHYRSVAEAAPGDADIVLARLQSDKGFQGDDELIDLDRLALQLAPAHEVVDALDDLAGPLGLAVDAGERAPQGGQVGAFE